MATMESTLRMFDGMSTSLTGINHVLNTVMHTFESVQDVSSQAIDVSGIRDARGRLAAVQTQLEGVQQEILNSTQEQNDLNNSLNQGGTQAKGLGDKIKSMMGSLMSLKAVREATRFIGGSLNAYGSQVEAETKLGEVMKRRMGATDDIVNSVKQLTVEQQRLGVVGDQAQLTGAQQLSMFLNTTDALKTLMPAMNDLAVQQNGAAASQDDLARTGEVMGSAMQGQSGELAGIGIMLSEAQEQVLKYGNEQERAAMLAQVITDNVGHMNTAMTQTPQGQIQQAKNDWEEIMEVVGQRLSPSVMRFFETLNENMPMVETIVMGFADVISFVIDLISNLIEGVVQIGTFISDNWSIIEPIVWGIVAALGAYAGYMLITNGIELISNGIKIVSCIASYAYSAATGKLASGVEAATVAQYGLNTALLSSPITWIIIGIIAVIAIIYAVVAAINKLTDSDISATGIICGSLSVAAAFIGNLFVTVINFVIDAFAVLWNFIATFVNFFANVFRDPVGAVARLFFDLVDTVLSLLQSLASAVDTIFGSDLAGSVRGWRDSLGGWVDDKFGKGIEIMAEMAPEDMHLDRFEYSGAWDKGYDFGQKVDKKVSEFNLEDALGGLGDLGDMEDYSNSLKDYGAGTGGMMDQPAMGDAAASDSLKNIDDNTADIKDSVSTSEEDLKYLREIAEKDAVNRFATTEIKIDMINNNTISSDSDIDGIVTKLEESLYKQMRVAKEGA